jgi:glutamate racemase
MLRVVCSPAPVGLDASGGAFGHRFVFSIYNAGKIPDTILVIGFFDSGLGGLTVLKEVEKLLPRYSTVYLGDNARTPYGSHSHDTIYRFTRQGVRELFARGAQLVILACNTASSSALRRIQQEWLLRQHPDRRVLGVIIPTAEEVVVRTRSKEVGVVGTEATVQSFAFPREITKLDKNIVVHQQACPLLVPIIEAGEMEWEGLGLAVGKYVGELFLKSKRIDTSTSLSINPQRGIDTLVLGCTHYALIEDMFRRYIPSGVAIVSQGVIVAQKIADYLVRHPEIETTLDASGSHEFLTTEDSWRVRELFRLFYGEGIVPRKIALR